MCRGTWPRRSGNVAAAQVGNHVDAAQFGQQGRVVGLARKAQFGPVADGLSVHRHGGNIGWRQAGVGQQRRHAVGIVARQLVGGGGFTFQLVVARRLQRQQVGAQRRRERDIGRTARGGCGAGPA